MSAALRWRWLGGFTVLLEWEGHRAYLDPFDLKEKVPPADLVLVSNPRVGHSSPEDVAAVAGPDTVVAGPAGAIAALPGTKRALAPGDEFEHRGLLVSAVPAGSRELSFFPLDRGWLGYVLTAGDRTLFFAGLTDRLPEPDRIRAETAFVPVSGRYLMGAEEARALADAVGATRRVALVLVGDRFRPLDGFSVADGD